MVSKESAIDAGLKAVSDTTRRGILGLLKSGQLSVLEIAEEFPMSRPAISKHLRILKEAGLVIETPAGRQRLYALETAPLERLTAWLAGFHGAGVRRSSFESGVAPGVASRRQIPIRRREAAADWRVW